VTARRHDVVRRDAYFAFSPLRVSAMVMRYWYLLRGSWPRILELAYWPTMQVVLWGFLTLYLAQNSSLFVQAFGVLLSAVLLWDVLFRGQLGVSMSFLEEMWSRNLGHLFVSPLRPYELLASLMTISLIKTVIGIVPASLLAYALFDFSVYSLGLPLVGFFINLIVMGWALGLVMAGLVLRYGLGAESLAWVAVFALAPLSAIYYPVAVLPPWVQPLTFILPASHVFEGMRAILIDGVYRPELMWTASALNVVYLISGSLGFLAFFRRARTLGLILNLGE
jgi:ABC-2 type transport system permease protein